MQLRLGRLEAEVANQYINTIDTGWLGRDALESLLFASLAAGSSVRQSRAMASLRKPVIVRKFSRDWVAGYAGAAFGQDQPHLEILDLGRQGAHHWLGAR